MTPGRSEPRTDGSRSYDPVAATTDPARIDHSASSSTAVTTPSYQPTAVAPSSSRMPGRAGRARLATASTIATVPARRGRGLRRGDAGPAAADDQHVDRQVARDPAVVAGSCRPAAAAHARRTRG